MNKSGSYEDVMKHVEELNDLLEAVDTEPSEVYNQKLTFKWEYAFESLTDRCSVYKRRNSNA